MRVAFAQLIPRAKSHSSNSHHSRLLGDESLSASFEPPEKTVRKQSPTQNSYYNQIDPSGFPSWTHRRKNKPFSQTHACHHLRITTAPIFTSGPWGIDKRRFAMLVFARLTDLRAYGGSALESRLALRLSALGSASLASLPFPNIMCGEAGACWLCALPCPNRSAPDDGHDRKSRVPQGQIGAPLLRDTLSQVALP